MREIGEKGARGLRTSLARTDTPTTVICLKLSDAKLQNTRVPLPNWSTHQRRFVGSTCVLPHIHTHAHSTRMERQSLQVSGYFSILARPANFSKYFWKQDPPQDVVLRRLASHRGALHDLPDINPDISLS